MNDDDFDISESIDRPPVQENSSATVWVVSLAFWVLLLIAALLYGSVALAPRLSEWMNIRHDYVANAHQVKALETEVDYLERVRDALKTDPEFLRRLAEVGVSKNRDRRSEVIPVSGLLVFGGEDQLQQRLPEIDPPVGADVVRMLASRPSLRTGLLATAGLCVVFGFTVLNGNGGWFVATTARIALAAVVMPLARYRRTAAVEVPDENQPPGVRDTTSL